MAIDKTQYLSKLSQSEMRSVHQLWPNPVKFLGRFFALLIIGFGAMGGMLAAKMPFAALLVMGIVLVAAIAMATRSFKQLGVARNKLNELAEQHQLPSAELFKEFRANLTAVGKAV